VPRSLKLPRIISGIQVLLALASAQAGPPFVTDDPEPPLPGGWEINVLFILERTAASNKVNADFTYAAKTIR
jgi:hypothetical protein